MLRAESASDLAGANLPDATPWHAVPVVEVLARLGSAEAGLQIPDAARRLTEQGPNRLPAAPPRSALRRFLAQFANLLIYVLLAAATVTAALGHPADTAVILGVVLINAIIGFVQAAPGRARATAPDHPASPR